MTCKDFEMLMADALGDELSIADRPAFEAHLAECEVCRREYETGRRTITAMRELPGPVRVSVRREGDRLVIDEKPVLARRMPWWWRGGVLRYAASLLIAFTAGYALHGGLTSTGHVPPTPSTSSDEVRLASNNLEHALLNAHARHPSRSALAKCLIAVGKGRG